MAYSDKATPRQIGAFLNLVQWQVTRAEEDAIRQYLQSRCNRKQMSEELGRVRDLYIDRRLTHDGVFDSPIWDAYKGKAEEGV